MTDLPASIAAARAAARRNTSEATQAARGPPIPYRAPRAPRPMPRQMRQQHMIAPRNEIAADVGVHEAMAPIRPLPRGPGPQQVATDLASGLGEIVGTEPFARGLATLRQGGSEPGTAMRAAPDLAMGGLGMLGLLGMAGDVGGAPRTPRPLPPTMYRSQMAPQSIADNMLVREPFMRPEADYEAALTPPAWSDRLFYHGTPRDIQGSFRPSRHPSLPEPTALSLTPNRDIAAQFGPNIHEVQVRGTMADAERFMARARELQAQGMSVAEASAQTQREFQGIGYRGVRWGDRETAVFNPAEDVRPAGDAVTPIPQSPARQIGPNGLPIREPTPFRQSFVGGSADLRDAARLNQRPDPHGEGVGADMRGPFYRRSEFAPDPSKAVNEATFWTQNRGYAAEFPRGQRAGDAPVHEYEAQIDTERLADFSNPEHRARIEAFLTPEERDIVRRNLRTQSGHADWVLSSDPAFRNAAKRAGFNGMWVDEGGGAGVSAAVFDNSPQITARRPVGNTPPRGEGPQARAPIDGIGQGRQSGRMASGNNPDSHGEGVGIHPAFEGMSRQEFLGSPRITTRRNAADLRPKALTTVADQPARPFMENLTIRMSPDGAAVYDGDKVVASYNFGDTLVVDPAYRRSGIAEELVYQWRTEHPGPAVARERTRASQRVQEKVWDRIERHPTNAPPRGEGPQADMSRRPMFPGRGPIRAYHGSPHDFDRFDLSKIGTGEGAQAYGHGLYFAENEGVARQYRERLADPVRVQDTTMPDAIAQERFRPQWDALVAQRRIAAGPDLRGDTSAIDAQMDTLHKQMLDDTFTRMRIAPNGRMYEVNIHAAPEQFLDWDAPLGAQPHERLANLLRNRAPDPRNSRAQSVINPSAPITGAQAYTTAAGELGGTRISGALKDAGIPGIRYLDEGSRGQKRWLVRHPQGGINDFADEQSARAFMQRYPDVGYTLTPPNLTHNYVVFDDRLIEILRKYGLAGLGIGAAAGAGAQQNAPAQ